MSLIHVVQNKCPKCHQGQVFSTNNLLTFRPATMKESCAHCGHNFSKEPGFYWGAMYVSYALATFEMAIVYAICILIFKFDALAISNLIASIVVVLGLFPFNFRMARLLWLYLFSGVVE
ncbi:uncharacterized protein (DUF983 family) [Runella defluvii]|uniref:Uncharacterized protein (DUF983 family) n=1 Tax=Runella defluvii TaxID=370973 RepID=A0A7W5ZJ07_9BACT|nr:DUF983 domain-containing protein [Runella defluvii]MBB3837995.1 uncharacterized protein (DUF983 family) [Runella defluvii]MCA0233390.1 DUF983 domain-containing protein [Bacteroidota bacterium]HAK77929.1 DUF983 domain-containing protein [Runella sp.]HAO48322.1 DUF983 domain-containing protein [Runella sp.]